MTDRDGIGLGITAILTFVMVIILLLVNTPKQTHDIAYPALWHSTYNKHKVQCDNQYDHLSLLSCEIVDRICESAGEDLTLEDCDA